MSTTNMPNQSAWKAWLPVIALSFAAFIFNTTEFLPIGLLSDIAKDFGMEEGRTGLIITVYAWVVAIMSLPLTVFTAKIERRLLLVILFILFIGSHLLAWCAWSFGSLMAARIGIACSHAVFWAITTPLAARIAPMHKRAKALSFIVTGSSLAIVLGVPIGTIVGQHTGWRNAFLCIAIVAFMVMLILIYLLPKLPSNNAGSFKSLPTLFRRPTLIHVYLLTAILVMAHFTAYSYVEPYMQHMGGFSKNFIVTLLLAVGFAGILGSVIFTKTSASYPIALPIMAIIVLTACLILLANSTFNHITAIVLCIFWGGAMTIIGLILQSKVLDVAYDASDVAIAMFSGIFNIGIGGGALLGGFILSHTDASYIYLGYAGSIFALIGLALFYFVARQNWLKYNAPIKSLD